MRASRVLIILLSIILGISVLFGYECYVKYEDVKQKNLNLRLSYETLKSGYEELEDNYADLWRKCSDLEENSRVIKLKLENVSSELRKLRKGDRYSLHDPAYNEVIRFIEEDRTDENDWIEGEYVCTDFANDINRHAMHEGIRCAEVSIVFRGKLGHMLVAFPTVDCGLIYVEPQLDAIIPNLKSG